MGAKKSKPKPSAPPPPVNLEKNCPSGYIWCADEGIDEENVCEWMGKVSYGAQGSFKYKNSKYAIQCTSGAFGGDPMKGVGKSCCG